MYCMITCTIKRTLHNQQLGGTDHKRSEITSVAQNGLNGRHQSWAGGTLWSIDVYSIYFNIFHGWLVRVTVPFHGFTQHPWFQDHIWKPHLLIIGQPSPWKITWVMLSSLICETTFFLFCDHFSIRWFFFFAFRFVLVFFHVWSNVWSPCVSTTTASSQPVPGDQCNRLHNRPTMSQTLLLSHMCRDGQGHFWCFLLKEPWSTGFFSLPSWYNYIQLVNIKTPAKIHGSDIF